MPLASNLSSVQISRDTGEYTEDFTDSVGYGRLGDFALINRGNATFGNRRQRKE